MRLKHRRTANARRSARRHLRIGKCYPLLNVLTGNRSVQLPFMGCYELLADELALFSSGVVFANILVIYPTVGFG